MNKTDWYVFILDANETVTIHSSVAHDAQEALERVTRTVEDRVDLRNAVRAFVVASTNVVEYAPKFEVVKELKGWDYV